MDNNIVPERIIDEELFNLLQTLQKAKATHRAICNRLRAQGIELYDQEQCFDENMDNIISSTSVLVSEQLRTNIIGGK